MSYQIKIPDDPERAAKLIREGLLRKASEPDTERPESLGSYLDDLARRYLEENPDMDPESLREELLGL